MLSNRNDTCERDNISRKKGKSNRINFRIDDEDLQLLNSISYEDDESMSQIIRKAIRQYDVLRKNRKMF